MRKKLSRSRVLKKKLNLKDIPDSSNKFLIIQIDALSYTLLKKHKEKYMPFLNKYLKSNNLEKYSSGYPSNTSFTQAGILYGENFNIPSFRFLDKTLILLSIKLFVSSSCSLSDSLSSIFFVLSTQ